MDEKKKIVPDFSFVELSEEEHRIVLHAREGYAEVLDNVEKIIDLLWSFIKSMNPECWLFSAYLSITRKFSYLALLSAVRCHSVQTKMCMRQVFESGALAAYSLHETNQDSFIEIKDKRLYQKESARVAAYKWLSENYGDHSNSIKALKDLINSSGAHSDISSSFLTFELTERGTISTEYFDKHDPYTVNVDIWHIANSCWGLLDLFRKIVAETKNLKLIDEFDQKMKELGDQNEKLKQELMKNPRVKKHLEEKQSTE